ncbi:hypothetical protein DAPPUDRAFT_41071 [Daphnia pulex]|uniref:Sugar phosphate transporter domain-containing protein n=1 Tax=Daphnia pulex TaxID=6669 RepID=E9FVA0_DAPPU|nr:hypothetical protein DAPPUDRAFT_41071 [Daphnia pulex]|eukprot:EFX88523.1 hypothetical protein DAPPUDRAFT_41071 [Daphnia pulex]
MTSGKTGLRHPTAIVLMIFWYIFSAFNLFANKYVISYLKGDPALLAMSQMLMCMCLGFLQLRYSCGLFVSRQSSGGWSSIHRNKLIQRPMLILGSLRFTTLVLGLTSLNYVPVSFAETIKSSAPMFTVIISSIFTGEKTGMYVNLSLIPIMGGLALCSATELSFNMQGFIAVLLTNLSECLQNVYSKVLLSSDRHKYGPAELQFFTSFASFVIQIMASFFLIDWAKIMLSPILVGAMLLNGAFFHFQSITEYALLEHITPVTHSVANTVKRALLIWLSIILFGNAISLYSGLGTLVVIAGVFGYNKARQLDAQRIQRLIMPEGYPQKIAL